MRFDFHWTRQGWQISEANADVPGGFAESSAFPRLVAAQLPGMCTCGDPGAAWAGAIADSFRSDHPVGLLSAAGYLEDHQVVAYLAEALRARAIETRLCQPANLRWDGSGVATLHAGARSIALAGLVRFFQSEWIAGLPARQGWRRLFHPAPATAIFNPATSIVIESKRFPLVWMHLSSTMPNWRRLMPPTTEPRQIDWQHDDRWVLKAAFSNNGDAVLCPGGRDPGWDRSQTRAALRSVRWRPCGWVAQRRFDIVPTPTPAGPMFACLGVYTVNGKAAGVYGRLSPTPVIDYSAIDAAVLVDQNDFDSAKEPRMYIRGFDAES